MKIESEMISEMYKFTREFFITMLILYGIVKLLYWEIPTFYLFIVSFLMAIITKIVGDYRVKKATLIIPTIFAVIIIMILMLFLGKDAVDYFLFEQKKGYCIYFASAMAIVCRYLDIPTRYIDGVALDYSDRDEDWYKVKTKEAHAWIEVYIEGFGWIRMDPTPGYKDIENWKFNSGNSQEYVSQTDNKLNDKVKISGQENKEQTSEENVLGTILLWLKYLFIGLTFLAILILIITGAIILNKKGYI